MIAVLDEPATRNRTSSSMRESYFSLENDPELIGAFVDLLLDELAGMNVGDETIRLRVGVALQEALSNAIYHGNLEVGSDLRQYDECRFYELATERRSIVPYRQRRVHVRATVDRHSATFVIRDEGPGFDVSRLDQLIDSEDLMRIGGRGLLLIRTFMDEVKYNSTGNEITLVKRCGGARRRLSSPSS